MSGEYVPTTEEIRYQHSSQDAGTHAEQRALLDLRFDRWLTAHDARIASEAAEKALRDAADKWTQGAWANNLPPRGADRLTLILGTSQRAGDFMRAEADRLTQGPPEE